MDLDKAVAATRAHRMAHVLSTQSGGTWRYDAERSRTKAGEPFEHVAFIKRADGMACRISTASGRLVLTLLSGTEDTGEKPFSFLIAAQSNKVFAVLTRKADAYAPRHAHTMRERAEHAAKERELDEVRLNLAHAGGKVNGSSVDVDMGTRPPGNDEYSSCTAHVSSAGVSLRMDWLTPHEAYAAIDAVRRVRKATP